jgi:hypothetical protein
MPSAWKNGMLEYWNIGDKSKNNLFKLLKTLLNPSFHYSIIPIGTKPPNSLVIS